MILECFQTVEDQHNPDYIERFGPFKCVRTDAWLGEGHYLWDSNIEWAHNWGGVYKTSGYVICQMSIQFDERIFDIWGNVMHQTEFKQALALLRGRGPKPSGGEIVARNVLAFLRKTAGFDYDGIRSADEPATVQVIKYNSGRREELIIGQRVQICLTNKNPLLSHTFRIVFPEGYVT